MSSRSESGVGRGDCNRDVCLFDSKVYMQMEPAPANREQRRLQKKLEKQSKGTKTKGFSSPADIVAQVVHTERRTD